MSKSPFREIENALKGLELLESTRSHEIEAALFRRIAAYREAHNDEVLERIVELVVRTRYPAAQPRTPRDVTFNCSKAIGIHSTLSPRGISDRMAKSSDKVPPLADLPKALVDTVLYRHYRLLLGKQERLDGDYSDPSLDAWRFPLQVAPQGSQVEHDADKADIGSLISKSSPCFPWQDLFYVDGSYHNCQLCDEKFTTDLDSAARK